MTASSRTELEREAGAVGEAAPRVPALARPPRAPLGVLVALALVAGAVVSVHGTGFDPVALVEGAGPIERFASELFPPDLSATTLEATARGVVESFEMSLLGALIGAGAALPLAAIGTAAGPQPGASRRARIAAAAPYHLARLVLNVFRSVPDILWALVFVVALGLGPFPGTLALAVHSTGVLGKLFSETLETVPARPVEALGAIGAGRLQRLAFGRLPQAVGDFVSLAMYQWECNIRSAAILGFVGAGGIGQQILVAMNVFDYPRVATLVGATVLVVLLVDRLSAAARSRLATAPA